MTITFELLTHIEAALRVEATETNRCIETIVLDILAEYLVFGDEPDGSPEELDQTSTSKYPAGYGKFRRFGVSQT